MQNLEDWRRLAIEAETELREYLKAEPELSALWDDFVKRGGTTSAELRTWLTDDDWHRKDLLLRQGHLRLISSKPAMEFRRKLRRRRDDDAPDAA